MNIDKEFAEKALDLLKTTGQFVLDQSNDIFKQMVQFEIYSDMVWIVFTLVLIISCCTVFYKTTKMEFDEFQLPIYILCVLTLLFSVGSFMSNTLALVKATTAPKVFLIEKLGQIAKGK